MRVLVVCKRGGEGPRNKWGHCLCAACTAFNRERYRAQNAARKEYRKKWQAENPEKLREYAKRWLEGNKEQRRSIEMSWRARNPERVAAHNKKAGAKWARENKGKRNAICQRRRTAKMQRTPPWADLEKIESFYVSAARMSADTGVPHEVDHIIPLQGKNVCGLHIHTNLRIVPRRVNRAKQNRMELELCAF